MIDLPENELALRAQAGDTDAEAALIERFEPFHHAHARRIPEHLRDDALQGARLGTIDAIRRFQPARGALSSFVHNFSKAGALRVMRPELPESATPIPAAPDAPDTTMYRGELAKQVRTAVENSSYFGPIDRLVFFRLILLGDDSPTLEGVADEIYYRFRRKCSPQAVRERSLRIRALLPKVLAPLARE